MGGGDLNLKKSWHPSTMKNMEKVWKAEQQKCQEKKRIAELKKEIEMEKDREDITKYAMEQGVIEKKDEKKLDWMYKGPNQSVNREEYLLGRPIDKPFEQMARAEKDTELDRAPKNHVEHECIPPSLRFFSGNEQVDLARKMQEDPLYAIKKKEMETRSQLLKNPVKLKQLRQLLEEQSKKSKIERKKKKKKHGKHGTDSDEETELDMLLASKYKQLKDRINDKDLIESMRKVKHKEKRNNRKRDSDGDTESSESESSGSEDISDGESIRKRKKKKSRSGSSENVARQNKHKKGKYRDKNGSKEAEKRDRLGKRNRERSASSKERSDSSIRERTNKGEKRSKGNDKHLISKSPLYRREDGSRKDGYDNREDNDGEGQHSLNKSDRSRSSYYSYSAKSSRGKYKEEGKINPKWNHEKMTKKKKKQQQQLTEEEKEQRRQEMMANATWRDKERERNVKQYREEEKKELSNNKTYNQDFIRKHLAVAAEVGTVASRIKSNINNIQRSGRAMDTNFAKR